MLEARKLLGNSLVMVAPRGNPAGVKSAEDLRGASVQKVALAGEKVPAGKYAEQALRALSLYQALIDEKKIVRGQDVRGTLAYVERAEVEAGIVYATDARVSREVESSRGSIRSCRDRTGTVLAGDPYCLDGDFAHGNRAKKPPPSRGRGWV